MRGWICVIDIVSLSRVSLVLLMGMVLPVFDLAADDPKNRPL